MKTVYSVEDVSFHLNKKNPLDLVVHAIGKVNSNYWCCGELAPKEYSHPPQDGIQDFDFIAKPPKGPVLWVLSKIEGNGSIKSANWMKGIRIHSANNKIEVLLSNESMMVEAGEFENA